MAEVQGLLGTAELVLGRHGAVATEEPVDNNSRVSSGFRLDQASFGMYSPRQTGGRMLPGEFVLVTRDFEWGFATHINLIVVVLCDELLEVGKDGVEEKQCRSVPEQTLRPSAPVTLKVFGHVSLVRLFLGTSIGAANLQRTGTLGLSALVWWPDGTELHHQAGMPSRLDRQCRVGAAAAEARVDA
ncbi:uncharacterized protein B0I36DRAFT_345047 [Microdochium trichocladiopsis]|uniref:Uncharacterized protein n=1 Tax=Microdochium trichocladiopsis TaxID=1682393 RepID=A0A9P9BXC1_9PEZI|nr:uncharacterized protein B0I36DRAFT_345047 [Microdochium trichocladiopsis]KAH7041445.1 hypothetical protein B0I36DRAFT_345047 [Microdochium trichocladiopsis]